MKTKTMLAQVLAVASLATFVSTSAFAADITKANNTTALNSGSSWVGGAAPTSADVGVWNATVTGANSVLLGADAN